jgi:hypothetical protein
MFRIPGGGRDSCPSPHLTKRICFAQSECQRRYGGERREGLLGKSDNAVPGQTRALIVGYFDFDDRSSWKFISTVTFADTGSRK